MREIGLGHDRRTVREVTRVSLAEDHLTWRRITVDGRPAVYGVGGDDGPPIVLTRDPVPPARPRSPNSQPRRNCGQVLAAVRKG